MHIPDGYLSPATCATLLAGSVPFWRMALRRVKKAMNSRQVPLLSLFAAFSFVIMMFNLPLPGGTTGHATGIGLATVVIGPWAAMLAVSVALVVQALFFGDGGVTAIGANCFNMAIAGALVALNQCADYWEVVREFYAPFDTGPKSGTAEVYLHEMPGGQYTNLKEQAESMGLGLRWHELARTYADVNMAFGDIVKVTPSSKVVGDMAIFLVNHNMTMEQFARLTPDHTLTLPTSVIEMFMGSLGEPDGGWTKALQAIILRGAKPNRGRPGAHLPKVDLEETAALIEKRIGRRPSHDEVLSYLMYPDVFLKCAKARQSYGDVEVLPTPAFYYGMQRGDEIAVELQPGKSLVVKFLTVGE